MNSKEADNIKIDALNWKEYRIKKFKFYL